MLRTAKRLLRVGFFRTMARLCGEEKGCVVLPTVRGPARGLRFALDAHGTESSYFLGTYDLPILRKLRAVCRKDWVYWDCGVYLGFYTAFFARLAGPGGRVVAFEPDPHNLSRCRANVARNGLTNVQFVQAAVGAPLGVTPFVISRNTNSHLPGAYYGWTPAEYRAIERIDDLIEVECLSPDQAYLRGDIPAPNLIKLDIEGAEKDALRHMGRLLAEVRPFLVLELHNPESDAAAWELARRTGYRLSSLDMGHAIRKFEDLTGTVLGTPP